MDLAAIGDPAEDARLIEVAQDFGERVGIPVRLESLTSGRELLLAVDREALAAAVAERLRQRDDVTSVEVADPPRSGRRPASPRLDGRVRAGQRFRRDGRERAARGARASARRRPGALEIEAGCSRRPRTGRCSRSIWTRS